MPDKDPPDGWRLARLAELAEVVGGTTPSRNQDGYFGGSIPWATPTDITRLSGGRFIGSTEAAITEKGRAAAGLRILPPGTILMTSRATIGKAAIARVPITTNQGFQNLIPNDDVEPLWLYYAVTGQRRLLERLAAGSTFREASRNTVRSLELLVPPRSEQTRIAEVLDSIDAAIEKTEAVIEASERLRSALLHELLTRGVPGWHSEWKDVPGIGTIPACWEVVRLGEVLASVEYGTGAQLSDVSAGVPVLRMNNVEGGEVVLDSVKWGVLPNEERQHLLLRPGDILFNRTNSIDLVGKVAIVRDVPHEMSFASYLLRLRADDAAADPFWLIALLNLPATQLALRRMATKGASQANINPTSLRSLAVPLPGLTEQKKIAEVSETLRKRCITEGTRLRRLGLLKAAAAAALLSGRVRVPTPEGR